MKKELTLEEIHEELLCQLRDITAVVGDQQYLRETYGMDAKSIADRAEAMIHEKRTDA